jgi:hypothetical protein
MPDLTPADELYAAAERIRVALDPAPPCQHPDCGHPEGWHKEDSDGQTVCTSCDYDAHDFINPGLEMPKGVGLPLMDLFEGTAERWRDDLRPEGLAVLHVARAVLTGGQQ